MKVERLITLEIGADKIRMGIFALHATGVIELLDTDAESCAAESSADMGREAAVAVALKRLLERTPPGVSRTVLALEGAAVFARLITLPPVSPEKRWQAVQHEAVQNIPFPVDEVVWDACAPDQESEGSEILLVAVKRDLISGLIHAVEANGLTVVSVNAAPVALANLACHQMPSRDEPVLLLDRSGRTGQVIFYDACRLFFRPLPVAGESVPRLIQEVQRSISFFRSQQGGRKPERILVYGEGENLDELQSGFDVPVELLDPVSSLKISCPIDHPQHLGVMAGLVLGWRGKGSVALNLLPESHRNSRKSLRQKSLLSACVGLAVLIPIIWIAGLHVNAALIHSNAAYLQSEIDALDAVVDRMEPVEKAVMDLETRISVCQQIEFNRSYWLRVLTSLERCVPDGMFVMESEPVFDNGIVKGMKIELVSYQDKEPPGEDVVVQLRDAVRADPAFSVDTRVISRPAKGLFARRFSVEVQFAEAMQ